MIRLVDVEKAYESGAGKTWVLRRINLEIKEGDFITVMGPSGAGKSTLMGIVGMLDGAWKGEYYLLDNPVHKLDNRKRAELHKKYIGFVFQQYHLPRQFDGRGESRLAAFVSRHEEDRARRNGGRRTRPLSDRRQEGAFFPINFPAGNSRSWLWRAR